MNSTQTVQSFITNLQYSRCVRKSEDQYNTKNTFLVLLTANCNSLLLGATIYEALQWNPVYWTEENA